MPNFPTTTHNISFTPSDVRNFLDDYAHNIGELPIFCEKHKIKLSEFFDVCGQFPEIGNFYRISRSQKAQVYADEAVKQWKGGPEKLDNYDPKAVNAVVQYHRYKSDAMLRVAAMCETGSYIQRTKSDNVNYNLSMTIPSNNIIDNSNNNASNMSTIDDLLDL
jgi:hypothetical protein